MPFSPRYLTNDLENKLRDFLKSNDFTRMYKEYFWRNDNWENGFPDIFKLEKKVLISAKGNFLCKEDIICIVIWGGFRNIKRVVCPESIKTTLYENGKINEALKENPLITLRELKNCIKGLGPTYLSKILRFAQPAEFGAIDTRIVRVVGNGDFDHKRHDWINIKVCNYGDGWYIPSQQSSWPSEYSKWINILRYFAMVLNNEKVFCPHPINFPKSNLRAEGVWECADVEMALFSYVSKYVKSKK
jgi:hypothetical protein